MNEPVNEPVVLVGANDADVAFKAYEADKAFEAYEAVPVRAPTNEPVNEPEITIPLATVEANDALVACVTLFITLVNVVPSPLV